MILRSAEDFPAWFEHLEYTLQFLGLPNVASELLDGKINDRVIKFRPDEEAVIKHLIAISIDNNKFIRSNGTTAQEDLYNLVHTLGFIKNYSEMVKMENEFAINIRDTVETSIRKWNVTETTFILSKFCIDPRRILTNIVMHFPNNLSFQPLIAIVRKHMNKTGTINVTDVIKEIHKTVDETCDMKPISTMFMFQNDNNNVLGRDNTRNLLTSQTINGIKKEWKTKTHHKKSKKSRFRASNFFMKGKFPKNCVFCGNDHLPFTCEHRREGVCWWCGADGHIKRNCLVMKKEFQEKQINALLTDNLARTALVDHVRRDADLFTRVTTSDRNDVSNGIVLDTGAQASVTGCISNLHSYSSFGDNNDNGIKSVTNTPVKVLGCGFLRLTLDFKTPKVIDILIYHCSNIEGTFISDDDIQDFGIDYRSINGQPYLCWKDEKLKLIKGDKLVYIPPSMFSVERNKTIAGIHEALGHVDRAIAEKSVAEGFAQIHNSEIIDSLEEKCLSCQIGKARRCNHKAGSRDKYTIPIPLHTFHADLLYINIDENDKEPLTDITFPIHKWVLTFTDDYSKMCFAFPLRKKNEFLIHFIRLYNYIKTTFKAQIAILHTDQGSEFINKTSRSVYDAMGITHVVTNGYASMENGVAERKNLTIKNDIRTNLVASKLDYSLWPVVLEYVISIRNKTIIRERNLSPESIIIQYYMPECERLELYPHKFKSFGRHGIWYDVASKKPSLMKTGIHCFYMGASQYPCASDARVLNGDKILAFIPQADGTHKPVIKHTTNVQYSIPVRILKDINLAELGIIVRPDDMPVDTQPNTNLSQVVVNTDNIQQVDNTYNSQIHFNTQSMHNNSGATKYNFINKTVSSFNKGVDNSNIGSNVDIDINKGFQVETQNDVPMVDVQSSTSNVGSATDVCPTSLDSLNNNMENTYANKSLVNAKDEVNKMQNVVGSSNVVDNDIAGSDMGRSTTGGEGITAVESKVGYTDDDSVGETEELSTEDVAKVKSFERMINNGNISEILDANKDNLVEVEVPKELQDSFNPHDTVTIPEGRLLRSRFQFKNVNAVKFAPNLSKRPGELPNPKRIVYQIVSKDPVEGPGWIAAFNNELNSHIHNGSWDHKPIVTGDPEVLKRTVKLDIICTEKRAAVGERPKKKVRFVLRGDRQDESTYSNTYSPTLPYDLLRIILAECVQSKRYSVFLDISTAYLNADIDHDIYVDLPAILEKDKPKMRIGEKVVHKVNRAIYGLKQSGRLWYQRLTDFLISIGFERRGDIPCVLIKPNKRNPDRISIIVGFFVDDMIVTGESKYEVNRFVERLNGEFNLKITNPDNNGYRDILGINVKENRDKKRNVLLSMDLSMSNYIKKMITKLGYEKEFKNSRKISTPLTPNFHFDKKTESKLVMTGVQLAQEIHWFREVVGCLQYLAISLRPDIAYAANYMARFCMYPHPKLKDELIRILRYTYHTREYKIRYTRFTSDIEQLNGRLITYSDADHAGDVMTRKSTLSSIFMMNGGPVAWFARVAKFAATSSTDAEVAAMVESGNGVSYYREVLSFLRILSSAYSRKREYEVCNDISGGVLEERNNLDPLIIFVDNTSAIYQAQKGVTSGRTKHSGLRVARANEIMEREHVLYQHIGTKEMLADILTKPVTAEVMNTLIPRILVTDPHKVKNI